MVLSVEFEIFILGKLDSIRFVVTFSVSVTLYITSVLGTVCSFVIIDV